VTHSDTSPVLVGHYISDSGASQWYVDRDRLTRRNSEQMRRRQPRLHLLLAEE
jgi:hypothetical protein